MADGELRVTIEDNYDPIEDIVNQMVDDPDYKEGEFVTVSLDERSYRVPKPLVDVFTETGFTVSDTGDTQNGA